jgi:uncharacterized membrane protein YoaK (UPF0700 family)
MFRHYGKTRTYRHNLKIAMLLSFVAGLVNVVGFLSVQTLTTNVTGHFAFFVDDIFKLRFFPALVYLLYIICFLTGSFASSFMIEAIARKSERYIYIVPVLAESIILAIIAFSGRYMQQQYPGFIACSLLLAMGMQNSLVTSISNAVVRTTHLTGLFTDLGIELSQLFFYKTPEQKQKLFSSVKLRLSIISFFFIGGITGGILYSFITIKALLPAAGILLTGLVYDSIKFRLILLKRKFSVQH